MKTELIEKHKLNFEAFMNSTKHGVYIFTTDVCEVCKDFEKEISDIDSQNLFFVECILRSEREALYELTTRIGLPQTVPFRFNSPDVPAIKMGLLFGEQMAELEEMIRSFDEERIDRDVIEEFGRRSETVLGIFPEDVDYREVQTNFQLKEGAALIPVPAGIGDEISRFIGSTINSVDYVAMFDANESSNFNERIRDVLTVSNAFKKELKLFRSEDYK